MPRALRSARRRRLQGVFEQKQALTGFCLVVIAARGIDFLYQDMLICDVLFQFPDVLLSFDENNVIGFWHLTRSLLVSGRIRSN